MCHFAVLFPSNLACFLDDMNTEKIHFLNTKDGSMFTYLSSSFVNETSDSLSFINVYRAYKTTPKSWEDRSRTETYPKQK